MYCPPPIRKGTGMPLSEQEQRLLDEMERNLYQNDADFVATVGVGRGRVNYRGIVLGAILFLVGIIVLLAGVGTQNSVVGVLGFAVMFAGVFVAATPSRRSTFARRPAPTQGTHRSSSFMDNLNQRWERRHDGREQ